MAFIEDCKSKKTTEAWKLISSPSGELHKFSWTFLTAELKNYITKEKQGHLFKNACPFCFPLTFITYEVIETTVGAVKVALWTAVIQQAVTTNLERNRTDLFTFFKLRILFYCFWESFKENIKKPLWYFGKYNSNSLITQVQPWYHSNECIRNTWRLDFLYVSSQRQFR